jgi:ribosome recycling factor
MQKIIDYFSQELMGIQVGRATKGLVEHIKIDAGYGFMPIGQLANITLPDSQSIKVEPWDKSSLSPIEKGIYDANTGLTPQNQGGYIMIKVPALTTERRDQLKKQISKMAEDCKARLRMLRQDELKNTKKEFEEKLISEDDKKFAEK